MFFFKQKRQYAPVKASLVDDEESEQFLPPAYIQPFAPSRQQVFTKRMWLVVIPNLALFCASIALSAYSYYWTWALRNNVNNALIKFTDYYSPLHDEFPISIREVTVNGSLLDMDNSLFRAPPSPEVDEAWDRIGSLKAHPISSAAILALGKDPSMTAKFTEDWGYGPDAHVAELDVLHQIHCLNAVRRDVHWKHYFGARYPDGDFPELHRVHTDHCIYIILQHLMCTASTDLITQPWVEGQLHPFPHFSINRKCRDFNAILAWHEDNMAGDVEKFKRLRRPEGQVPVPMSEEFKRLFGYDHDHNHGDHA